MPFPIQPFLSKSDLQNIRLIDANIDDQKIESYILEAQYFEMRPIVGDEIYYLMQQDYTGTAFQLPRFVDLWTGAQWLFNDRLIAFEGLKDCISYYAYARILNDGKINVTRYGVKSLLDENSEDIADGAQRVAWRQAVSVAIGKGADAERFLRSARDAQGNLIYPEWLKNDRRKKASAFNIYNISRGDFRAPSKSGRGGVQTQPTGNEYDNGAYDVSQYQGSPVSAAEYDTAQYDTDAYS